MAKHINLEDAKGKFEFCTKDMLGSWIAAMLDSLPTIDIVHCGECKYWKGSRPTSEDDFCSYGVRISNSHGERVDNE